MDDLLTEGKIILALLAALIVVFGIDSAVSKIRKRTRDSKGSKTEKRQNKKKENKVGRCILVLAVPPIQISFAKPAQTGIIIR